MDALALRVRGEFVEMAGLRLTVPQAARLFGVAPHVAPAVLDQLHQASVLTCSNARIYSLIAASATHRRPEEPKGDSPMAPTQSRPDGSLRDVSLDRLACLLRHWTWADEARQRFEQELTGGWDYEEEPVADHPFGAYYHWCALLCGFAEAAVDDELILPTQLEGLYPDLERTLPGLRACRRLLVEIPTSLEDQPRVMDILRDEEALARLRRVHQAFGELLAQERMAREIESLDH